MAEEKKLTMKMDFGNGVFGVYEFDNQLAYTEGMMIATQVNNSFEDFRNIYLGASFDASLLTEDKKEKLTKIIEDSKVYSTANVKNGKVYCYFPLISLQMTVMLFELHQEQYNVYKFNNLKSVFDFVISNMTEGKVVA
jgi:dihydroorotase